MTGLFLNVSLASTSPPSQGRGYDFAALFEDSGKRLYRMRGTGPFLAYMQYLCGVTIKIEDGGFL